ncbi:MAG: SixA phosphatase family protein [Acidimicrobiales bacterium]
MTSGGQPAERLVWLLRHAKAAADAPPGGGDHQRPLAPRGRRDAAALGHCIGAGGLGFGEDELPAHVVCSTAARTTETAEQVCAPLGLELDRRRRLYYGTLDDVLAELRTLDDGCRAVMVVGHNPATHALALELLSEQAPGRDRLSSYPTCALAVIRVGAARWRGLAIGTGTLAGYFVPPYATR